MSNAAIRFRCRSPRNSIAPIGNTSPALTLILLIAVLFAQAPRIAIAGGPRYLGEVFPNESVQATRFAWIDDEVRPVLRNSFYIHNVGRGDKFRPQKIVDPETGSVRWRFSFTQRLPEIADSSGRVLIAPKYMKGSEWLSLAPQLVSVSRSKSGPKLLYAFELPFVPAKDFIIATYPLHESPVHASIDLEVPKEATLEFSIGVIEAWQRFGPVEFSIEVCQAEGCRELFREIVPLIDEPETALGWLPRRVSMFDYAGQNISLRFTAKASDGGEDVPIAYFADPTVLEAPQQAEGQGLEPNLLLISIDTLGANHVSGYGYPRLTTPYLDKFFGQNGSVFEHCVSAASSTMPSHMTMLTSLTPLVHGSQNLEGFQHPDRIPTLQRWLRGKGFATVAMTEHGAIARSRGFGYGFAIQRENMNVETREQRRTIERTFSDAFTMLRDLHREPQRRFFFFLHSYKPHTPYLPPNRYNKLFGTKDPGFEDPAISGIWAPRRHDREIRYVDDQLRILFTRLKHEGILENTIVILTSDHGEALLEHGGLGHGAYAYEEVLHVPLLIAGPGIPAGLRIREPVSHLDLMPTILDLLAVEHPTGLMGRSYHGLLSRQRKPGDWNPKPIFSEAHIELAISGTGKRLILQPTYAVRDGDHKMIRFRTEEGFRYELYDLEADPGEQRDIYSSGRPIAVRLRQQIIDYEEESVAIRKQLGIGAEGEQKLKPSAEDTEMLRALGYLE